ncbi:MAG: hypothetical protein G01um1014107_351 [Parcubacteria group bacterium Gr01-1014_107]|nr:MAG: hypothetical protein G01um1014107_351 [Parcubacteria group bacterium Gr01-1014_107]
MRWFKLFLTTTVLLLVVFGSGCGMRIGSFDGGGYGGGYGYGGGFYGYDHRFSSIERHDHVDRKRVVAGWSSHCGAYRHSNEYISTHDTTIRRRY